jgi:hypothetical protein
MVPNVSAAARAANISRRAAYDWRDDDEAFRDEWDDAVAESIDGLEQVAWERAQDQSDRLIEILLKAHRPDKYVERKAVEFSGKVAARIELVPLEGPDTTSS